MRTLKGDSVQPMPCGVGPVSHAGSHVPVTKFCFVGATRRDRTGDLLITKQTRLVFWTFFTAQVIEFYRSAFFGDRPIWTQTTADHCKFHPAKNKLRRQPVRTEVRPRRIYLPQIGLTQCSLHSAKYFVEFRQRRHLIPKTVRPQRSQAGLFVADSFCDTLTRLPAKFELLPHRRR
jgi:hypothetical protein